MIKKWWHDKVAYQIYPKSFMDSNGDGIGDLRGIISRLDYLKELGIDIIWLSPVYQSPFVDEGYDISDYYGIAEEFGTMEDFEELLEETKKRDMYLVMDLVINHCSDQHEWFRKALAEPDGEYADYFYFRKGKHGKEPNNMRSYFGGSAWEKVPGTDKYYLHFFAKEQPDLNWENPKVREELFKMVNWWLEKGVAGFRIDAIMNIKKDISFPDYEPDGPDGMVICEKMVKSVDGIGEFLGEMKRAAFDKHDAFTVGEVFGMKESEMPQFIGNEGYFSTMFDFSALDWNSSASCWGDFKPFEFKPWRDSLFSSQIETQKVGFKANIIENHDQPRGVSRYLPEYAKNDMGKKMLAATSILMRGIPFLYQGQEIGMMNCPMAGIEEYDDISTKGEYRKALAAGYTEEEALKACQNNSRDNARTPMQWSSGEHAGFTTGNPWMKLNPNYHEINVASQIEKEDSVLGFYKRLIGLRKSEEYCELFTYGEFVPAYENEEGIYAFYRCLGEKKVLLAANFGKQRHLLKLPEEESGENRFLLGNRTGRTAGADNGQIVLESCEVIIIEV